MERGHVWNALRYVDRNPVRALMVEQPRDWRWSSARAHHARELDEFGVLATEWLEWEDWPDWDEFVNTPDTAEEARLRLYTKQSRPIGSQMFTERCEYVCGRRLTPGVPGRPKSHGLLSGARAG